MGGPVVLRVRPRPRTRTPSAPCSASAGITIPQRMQQAPQSCAPTSKALTLSSASLVALPKPDLQKQNKTNKKNKTTSMEGEFVLKDPAAPVAGRPTPEQLASGPSLSSPFLPFRCPRRACLGYPHGQAAQRSYKAQPEAAAVQVQGQKLNWGGARDIDLTPILSLTKLKRVFLTS